MQKQSNQAGRYCACGNKAREGRTKCNTCKSRQWREANPEAAVYNSLRKNAKRRRVGFFITFDEFLEWLMDNLVYMDFRGREADSLTIDRKDPTLGYRAGNLQVLTLSQNIKKYKAGECWTPTKQTKDEAGTPF